MKKIFYFIAALVTVCALTCCGHQTKTVEQVEVDTVAVDTIETVDSVAQDTIVVSE